MNEASDASNGLCEVHIAHTPRSHLIEAHHVWPLGHGGPDIAENKVRVCPTGHYNIHKLLAEWMKVSGDPGFNVTRWFTVKEREYAKLGFTRIKNGSM